MANEFIIKINKDSNGNEVSLGNMPIEAADALQIFIQSLSEFAKLHESSADLRLSLKNGCIETALIYSEEDTIIDEEIHDVVNGDSQDNDIIKFLKTIQDRIKLNGLDYSVLHKVDQDTQDLTEKFKSKNFAYKRNANINWKYKVVFIEGELFESGGKKRTNVHITNPVRDYKVECNQQQAKKLNESLFEKVYLSAVRKWALDHDESFHFIDRYLTKEKYLEYRNLFESVENNNDLERYDVVHQKILDIVNNKDVSIGEVLKIMRLYNFKHSDTGVIRTILMTIKPIKNQDDRLAAMYNELAETLKSKKNKLKKV